MIEAADDPAAESWRNINAIDDLVEAILTTTGKLTVAALAGNAAAGGLMLALAADEVWCRGGAVLNPHYRLMGLHGSEYWTYTLPRRVGADQAARLTEACLPVSPASALRCGLVHRVIERRGRRVPRTGGRPGRAARPQPRLPAAARRQGTRLRLAAAAAAGSLPPGRTRHHEPELPRPREPYPQLRRAFVYKHKPTRTPPHLATTSRVPAMGVRT